MFTSEKYIEAAFHEENLPFLRDSNCFKNAIQLMSIFKDCLRMVDNIQLSEFCMIDLRGTEDTLREKFRCRLDTEPQHTLYVIRNVVDSIFDHPCKYLTG